MKDRLQPEDLRLWAIVAATVKPAKGRAVPQAPKPIALHAHPPPGPMKAKVKGPAPKPRPTPPPAPQSIAAIIEPGRRRRIERERDPLTARIDLHGLNHDRARAALEITGKGRSGDGVLKRFAPEWLAAPTLRPIVAGVSDAHRRHGGEGALYVALKKKA